MKTQRRLAPVSGLAAAGLLIASSAFLVTSTSCQTARVDEPVQRYPLEVLRGFGDEYHVFGNQNFSRDARTPHDGRAQYVSLISSERDPSTLTYDYSEDSHPVAFDVRRVMGVHANLIVVEGRSTAGEVIFQSWTIPKVPGAYYTERPLPTQPVGVEAPESEVSTYIWGPYRSPEDRTLTGSTPAERERSRRARLPLREEIYRGSGISDAACWDVDPHYRFILVYSRNDGVLWRLSTDGSGATSVVDTAIQRAALADARDIAAIRHPVAGRGFLVSTRSHGVIVYWDQGNDGIFGLVEEFSDEAFAIEYPGEEFVPL